MHHLIFTSTLTQIIARRRVSAVPQVQARDDRMTGTQKIDITLSKTLVDRYLYDLYDVDILFVESV